MEETDGKQLENVEETALADVQAASQEAVEDYSGDRIRTLVWYEHIRQRPGMYIGRLGDGTQPEDGVYVLLKVGLRSTFSMRPSPTGLPLLSMRNTSLPSSTSYSTGRKSVFLLRS